MRSTCSILKDEDVYRKYLRTAGLIVQELGGDLVVMGRRTPEVPVHFPGTTIGGGQRWLCVPKTLFELMT
jgi:hypothetical protein